MCVSKSFPLLHVIEKSYNKNLSMNTLEVIELLLRFIAYKETGAVFPHSDILAK